MSPATLSDRPYTNANLFSGHYLDERIQDREEWNCDAAAQEALAELQALYDLESEPVDRDSEDPLIDNWIDEVLEVLGFGTNAETTLPGGGGYVDAVLFEDTEARRDAAAVSLDTEGTTDLFDRGVGIVEAKRWDADFTTRFSDQRPYRNASHQIKHYLERTPESIQWGILTNGRKWRLYGTDEYETRTYYEIDLPELLERGDGEPFKYFYLFFRPEAFRESGGTTFLDSVRSESETVAQELSEDLQDNVFTAVRVLGRGFVETNDLEIDPDDDAALAELKEQSLVLLYRLLFVLYAESRGLLHPESGDAVAESEATFCLDELRLEIHEEIGAVDAGFDEAYSEHATTMWRRLEDLFRLIDEGEASLGVPPYNGGLFDRDHHEFLTEHAVSDRYLAEVVYRISTTENDEGRYVLADYADLDTRHLGSVYEGLLEHRFRIAPEEYAAVAEDGGQVWKPASTVSVAEAVETVDEGGLYVVNDDGERKATGAYYTPDDVVTDIVEKTVGPLVEEIDADLESRGLDPGTHEYVGALYRRVTDLTLLDPAMGSGHFLTRATEYLAKQVMAAVRELDEATAFDERRVRRDVAKECIYGVDRNGMAVELAKLSMWLETLAADQPLAFLDHHLKAGNSLVGSDVTAVLSSDAADGDGQLTLQQALARVRQATLEHVMERMQALLEIDNESLEDVESMAETYDEVRGDPFYQRLFELTNVHTAERFELAVPDGAYERMAQAIDDDEQWAEIREERWFQTAQAMSEDEAFFHWELEYPEVFFGDDGELRADAGFDAVIGNPPWVATAGRSDTSANMETSIRDYLEDAYTTTNQQFDLYVAFYEQFVTLAADERTGIVVPDAILTREQNAHIRRFLLDRTELTHVLHIGTAFENVQNGAAVLVSGTTDGGIRCAAVDGRIDEGTVNYDEIPHSVFREQDGFRFLLSLDEPTRSVLEKVEAHPRLGDVVTVSRGEEISKRANVLAETTDEHRSAAIVPGSAIEPYGFDRSETRYIAADDIEKDPENYESPKLVFRQTAAAPIGTIDTESRFTIKSVYNIKARGSDADLSRLLGVLNSSLLEYYHEVKYAAYRSVFPQINQSTFESYPVALAESEPLAELVADRRDLTRSRNELGLSLRNHLGQYRAGEELSSIGRFEPEADLESPLRSTTSGLDNLRIGDCVVDRLAATTVRIDVTARYKPEDEGKAGTDRWGYTETEPVPALRLSALTETEADLIEAFVPVAVDEADGFANFRRTATKTNSPIDRLRNLTLPAVDDVRDGLERYLEATERATALEDAIAATDERIDELVYELYGLTAEEIELVEDAVGE